MDEGRCKGTIPKNEMQMTLRRDAVLGDRVTERYGERNGSIHRQRYAADLEKTTGRGGLLQRREDDQNSISKPAMGKNAHWYTVSRVPSSLYRMPATFFVLSTFCTDRYSARFQEDRFQRDSHVRSRRW